MKAMRVLIVDDEPDSAEFLRIMLEEAGYDARSAPTAQETREILNDWSPHVVLLDLRLPDVEGLALLHEIRHASPVTQVIVVSAHGSISVAVEAMDSGALTFIEKPINPGVLSAQLLKAADRLDLVTENRRLQAELETSGLFPGMIGRSKPMRQLAQLIRSVAPTDANVLITGESGAGKEVVATAIHEHSRRVDGPFVKVNCAAIPSDLMESELFGYRRGAFTGALIDKQGLMEVANNGSLLLDEIGELAPNLQVKLLRVLQDHEFRPVGSTKVLKPNFRLICSTNVNIDHGLKAGKIREDLYFRINTLTISLPPLRDRQADIPLLAEFFLKTFAVQHGRRVTRLRGDVLRALGEYHWPGNVRELQHVIERAVILARSEAITMGDLPEAITGIKIHS
jgi:DNA-binding NtrC family response regulator